MTSIDQATQVGIEALLPHYKIKTILATDPVYRLIPEGQRAARAMADNLIRVMKQGTDEAVEYYFNYRINCYFATADEARVYAADVLDEYNRRFGYAGFLVNRCPSGDFIRQN